MGFKPLSDRILVKRLSEEEKTRGGIIIPDTAKEKPATGLIMALGNGKVLENGQKKGFDVKVGDKVFFSKYSGTEIKIGNEEHLIMREDDILGIVED